MYKTRTSNTFHKYLASISKLLLLLHMVAVRTIKFKIELGMGKKEKKNRIRTLKTVKRNQYKTKQQQLLVLLSFQCISALLTAVAFAEAFWPSSVNEKKIIYGENKKYFKQLRSHKKLHLAVVAKRQTTSSQAVLPPFSRLYLSPSSRTNFYWVPSIP